MSSPPSPPIEGETIFTAPTTTPFPTQKAPRTIATFTMLMAVNHLALHCRRRRHHCHKRLAFLSVFLGVLCAASCGWRFVLSLFLAGDWRLNKKRRTTVRRIVILSLTIYYRLLTNHFFFLRPAPVKPCQIRQPFPCRMVQPFRCKPPAPVAGLSPRCVHAGVRPEPEHIL